jgi:hypothetical protein
MNIFSIGTAATYTKTMELGIKWQKRKENPLLAKGREKEEDPQIAAFKQQLKEHKQAQTMSGIQGKMKAGLRLSANEMEYLRANAPLEYEKAKQIEREREEYKRELERCRTKEDVDKLNQRKMQQFVTEARAVSHNPNIPHEKKQELLEFIGMRMMATMNEHYRFIKTPEYKELPDRQEDDDGRKPVKAREKRKINLAYKTSMEELKELLQDVFPISKKTI